MSQNSHRNGCEPEVNSKNCRNKPPINYRPRNRKTVPQTHTADLQSKCGARHAHTCVCRTHDRLDTCPHPAARVTRPENHVTH
eukprot:2148886-Prymnesium_polylepis.1